MVGETVGVLEDTAANHKTIYFWVFLMQSFGMVFVFDVAVDDQLGFWADFISEFDDFGD